MQDFVGICISFSENLIPWKRLPGLQTSHLQNLYQHRNTQFFFFFFLSDHSMAQFIKYEVKLSIAVSQCTFLVENTWVKETRIFNFCFERKGNLIVIGILHTLFCLILLASPWYYSFLIFKMKNLRKLILKKE